MLATCIHKISSILCIEKRKLIKFIEYSLSLIKFKYFNESTRCRRAQI